SRARLTYPASEGAPGKPALLNGSGDIQGGHGSDDSYHGTYDVGNGPWAPRVATAVTGSRYRDAAGRPRQGRPRDALGRPLPYGASGVEPVPEEPLPPSQTLDLARSLVHEGRPFAAHEVLEARWKAGPGEERDLWQGLAQVCVGLTHAARGHSVGAVRLLDRGAARLEEYRAGGGCTYGLDLAAVVTCARERTATRR
ncbi:MAG TPA: DUF309 domain-containing protein, partial [Candidatus Lustribacter sp.]|nr:DUF309 domain-containing protein [Candidatus Lustribacter sp.]